MKNTEFRTHTLTEFGLGLDVRKSKTFDTSEETFMHFWKNMPKRLNWFEVEFEFDGELLSVSREHFRENRFDFTLTVETN